MTTIKSGMDPVHPGLVLREELDELCLSSNALASAIDVPADRVKAILNADQCLDADTAQRLAKHFGTTVQFWCRLQQTWQLRADSQDSVRLFRP